MYTMNATDSVTTGFRESLGSGDLTVLLEAHDGLSARLVEEAGFDGIWASSLSMSASMGVRDNNEMTRSQVLQKAECMSDATEIPILVDADTGYGDFNNFRRFAANLKQRGVAAVCVEDKTFPKTNSFVGDETDQPLARIEEFTGKIRAAKEYVGDDDLCVVARVEAFIAGYGLDEALERADAYHEAGADAIFIHSKQPYADEVLSFARAWDRDCPVVVVPTTYYDTPMAAFREAGVSAVIWANHMLRAAVEHMQHVANRIRAEGTVRGVEEDAEIAPVEEVFRLQGVPELREAKAEYLRSG
jgi:phosphoenolpyruvate phosphomutase